MSIKPNSPKQMIEYAGKYNADINKVIASLEDLNLSAKALDDITEVLSYLKK